MSLDCRGTEKKEALIRENRMNVVARLRQYNGQTIEGCCGPVKTEYFIFRAIGKKTKREQFILVGSDCGRQFLKLLNRELPPLFNANKAESTNLTRTSSEGTNSRHNTESRLPTSDVLKRLTPLNLEFYEAIHLLVSAWGGRCGGPLADMLDYLKRNPERDTNVTSLKRFNNIISKDKRNRGLRGMAASLREHNPGMKFFKFPLMKCELENVGVELKL